MIKLHFIEHSRAFRILWLLEEIGVDYKIIQHERNLRYFYADDSLKNIHPLGKSPVIQDDISGEQITVAESAVIVEYLIDTYAPELKLDAAEVKPAVIREYNYWMHYSEGSLMNFLTTAFVFYRLRRTPMPFFAKPILERISNKVWEVYVHPNIKLNIEYIENHLKHSEWIAGSRLTGADFMMCFPLEGLVQQMSRVEPMINSKKYLDRLRQRPAYQKALELNGELFKWK